ncbi:opacity protein [Methylobacterium radiotolerans]|nr:opacity protein [Methylobacterium radiotolerans]
MAGAAVPATAADLQPAHLSSGTELRGTLPAGLDAEFSGFYLRGDIGFSNQRVERLSNSLDALGTIEKINLGFAGAPLAGIGAGYQFNRWFRADVTGEYRSAAAFTGLERYRDATLPLGYGTDEYTATKRDLVVLANGYVDLGTYYGITPFLGAGLGVASSTIANFKDTNVVTQGVAYAKSGTKANLAWALHAGLGYDVTPAFKIELAYRYLNLGDAKTGTVYTYAGQCGSCEALTFKNVESHDVKLGLRWLLAAPAPVPVPVVDQAPLVRKY